VRIHRNRAHVSGTFITFALLAIFFCIVGYGGLVVADTRGANRFVLHIVSGAGFVLAAACVVGLFLWPRKPPPKGVGSRSAR
jgi:hypothetical protein